MRHIDNNGAALCKNLSSHNNMDKINWSGDKY